MTVLLHSKRECTSLAGGEPRVLTVWKHCHGRRTDVFIRKIWLLGNRISRFTGPLKDTAIAERLCQDDVFQRTKCLMFSVSGNYEATAKVPDGTTRFGVNVLSTSQDYSETNTSEA